MNNDLYLDPRSHDLEFSPTGDLQLVSAARRVAQQIKVTLLAFQGEWFLDNTFGVPYLEQILGHKPRMAAVNAIFREKILAVPGVVRVARIKLTLNREMRRLTVEFEAETAEGLTGVHRVSLVFKRSV